ncbi:6944_t:CDS:1, partial [Entrophospora sp. SA101]
KLPNTYPIPVTIEEEEKQSATSSMSSNDLICVILALIESLNKVNLPQFKGLKSKRKDELLQIFQQ